MSSTDFYELSLTEVSKPKLGSSFAFRKLQVRVRFTLLEANVLCIRLKTLINITNDFCMCESMCRACACVHDNVRCVQSEGGKEICLGLLTELGEREGGREEGRERRVTWIGRARFQMEL